MSSVADGRANSSLTSSAEPTTPASPGSIHRNSPPGGRILAGCSKCKKRRRRSNPRWHRHHPQPKSPPPGPGEALLHRNAAHPGAVRPAISGEVAEEWADFGGDGVEDCLAFFDISLRRLTAEAVRND